MACLPQQMTMAWVHEIGMWMSHILTRLAASEVIAIQPSAQPRPGILVVSLHEGAGLSFPQHEQALNPNHQSTISSSKYLPYALLDFDKLQVFVNAVSSKPENPLWAGDSTTHKLDVSRVSKLSIHLFLPNPNPPPGSGRTMDVFLGIARLIPRFEEAKSILRILS